MKLFQEGNRLIVQIEQEQSIREVLDFFHIARKTRVLYFQEHKIHVNKRTVYQDCVLAKGDELSIEAFIEEPIDFIADEPTFTVVYEDDLLLIVDKPAGLLVHPDSKDKRGTLANQVAGYYLKTHQSHTVRPIHRLDLETSGLVLFSKCSFFQPFLDAMLAQKKINRRYLAVVQGSMKPKQTLTIDAPIGADRHVNNKYRISKTGKPACTHVTCLKENQRKKISLVECTLETGRTHQIRVHLASIQHPILSDPIYGKPSPYINRCALQAYALCFVHPLSLKMKTVEIAMSEDLAACMKKI